jgi:glycerol kinase
MPYEPLGWRTQQGALDTTGNNPSRWTVAFTSDIINVNVAIAEVYKIVATGAAAGATFNVYLNNAAWDVAVYATQNAWDPQQPLSLRAGDAVYFYYSSLATDGHQPTVTLWLRWETGLSLFGLGRTS